MEGQPSCFTIRKCTSPHTATFKVITDTDSKLYKPWGSHIWAISSLDVCHRRLLFHPWAWNSAQLPQNGTCDPNSRKCRLTQTLANHRPLQPRLALSTVNHFTRFGWRSNSIATRYTAISGKWKEHYYPVILDSLLTTTGPTCWLWSVLVLPPSTSVPRQVVTLNIPCTSAPHLSRYPSLRSPWLYSIPSFFAHHGADHLLILS